MELTLDQLKSQYLTTLHERLLDNDEDARYTAAREAVRQGPGVIDAALDWLQEPSPRIREMASYMLGRIGHLTDETKCSNECRRSVPALVRVLEGDPDGRVRALAAFALGHHMDPATVPTLIRACADRELETREAVAYALGCFRRSYWDDDLLAKAQVTACLLRLMNDDSSDVRTWAVIGIRQGGHDTDQTRDRLWKALDDDDTGVRGEAAEALATFGSRSLVARLGSLLLDFDALAPGYFAAAKTLGDPLLLPSVRRAAQRWKSTLKPGEELPTVVRAAVEELERIDLEGR